MTVEVDNQNNTTVTADCGASKHAIGGGGSSNSFNLIKSYPATSNTGTPSTDASTNPRYWAAVFSGATGSNTAYAVCVPN